MALEPGHKLGPYEVLAVVGSGGMGEVYRARDTRLDRSVAIKVLLSGLSSNPELKQRLEREAKAISSLQHANICTLYDVGSQDGIDFLVMEYMDGQTLAERLKKGTLPLPEALKIGSEIANALDKAHRQGIIHRDLKPGNIMLTKSGAKLMDFGLAKPTMAVAAGFAVGPITPSTPTMNLASLTSSSSPLTQKGSIVGTFQYLAPEVLQGAEADERSDIFSFGCVLYEMVTGRRAFEGKTQVKVMAAILEDEPLPVTTVRPGLPASLDRLVTGCLNKDPEKRIQCARDLAMQLEWFSTENPDIAAPGRKANWIRTAAIAVLVLLCAGLLLGLLRSGATTPIALEAYILPPDGHRFTLNADDSSGPVVLSRDGKNVAFVAVDNNDDVTQLYVRPLSSQQAFAIPGTQGAEYPFWSADGKSIGFFSAGKLRRVAISGGPVLEICDTPRPRGGTWAPDDTILFAPDITSGIYRVSASLGSAPTEIVPRVGGNTTNRWPSILPDGKHFVYLGSNHSDPYASNVHGIYLASMDGKENRFLVPADSNATFADGYLLWVQNGSLMARRFDPVRGTFSGDTVGVIDGVGYSTSTWRAAFDVTSNGVAVLQAGSGSKNHELRVVGHDGKTEHSFAEADHVLDIRISPDGRKAAILAGGPPFNIWIVDLEKGTRVRLTFDSTPEGMAWSPDSRMIYYSAGRSNEGELLREPVDGTGQPEVLFRTDHTLHMENISPDGKYLLFEQPAPSVVSTTWVLPLNPRSEPRVLVHDPIGAHSGGISPDGRWALYHTTETGRYEIYATSITDGGKIQLTSTGAAFSRWSKDGKDIYYLATNGDVMMLPVTETTRSIQAGTPKLLFKTPALSPTSFFAVSWDATPDGKHFLLNTTGTRNDGAQAIVLLDWERRLKK